LRDAASDFTWVDGERLIRFGEAGLAELGGLLSGREFEHYVLLTTDRALAQVPSAQDGADLVLNVPPGPVPNAAASVRGRVKGRPLVALGGGRVIDSAKSIAGVDGLRCAAIPTTLSGAEMTGFHRMPTGVSEFKLVRPALVIGAPSLMASQPMPDLAASAMNALAHAIEALYAPLANPVGELTALQAAELIRSGLSGETPDGRDLALGSLLAGYASGVSGFAVHHAVCQTIVRLEGTPHAKTNAVMLPHFVRLMAPRAPVAIEKLAVALGAGARAEAAPDRVAQLAARAQVSRLSELGVERGSLDTIVNAALEHPAMSNTPSPPSGDELRRMLEQAL
jgi:alcohol dehydrogenase class IV